MNRPILCVKLCGNCNPAIESVQVAKKIAQSLGAELVFSDCANAQFALVINGCQVGCVNPPDARQVRIDGLNLNRYACADEAELIAKSVALLREQSQSIPSHITEL